jgi:hypothetical protein
MDNMDEEEREPLEIFIPRTIALLRARGADIYTKQIESFFELFIDGESKGLWGSLGLVAVLCQYRDRTYPPSYFEGRGIPTHLN